MRDVDEITGVIVDAAFGIHTRLGPGLMESVYEAVLARELERRGLSVRRQAVVRFEYDGMIFDEGLRVDLLVEETVVLELKSVERITPVHGKQVLTYLRLLRQPVGLLINFGAATLKDGLKRIVNNYSPSPRSSATPRLRVNHPPRRSSSTPATRHPPASENAEGSVTDSAPPREAFRA